MSGLGGSKRLAHLDLVQRFATAKSHEIPQLLQLLKRHFPDKRLNRCAHRNDFFKKWSEIVQVADSWYRSGIYPLTTNDFQLLGRNDLAEFHFLLALGPRNLLKNNTVSILNSRRPKSVNPQDKWLLETIAAVSEVVSNGLTLVSSLGAIQYVITTAASKGNNLIVVCESTEQLVRLAGVGPGFSEQYSQLLETEKTLFISAAPHSGDGSKKSRSLLRDRLVFCLSDSIYAIDIRPGGNMSQMVDEAKKRSTPVLAINPDVMKRQESQSVASKINKKSSCREISAGKECILPDSSGIGSRGMFFSDHLGSWVVGCLNDLDWLEDASASLFHYTRSCAGPWPGQNYDAYIMSILEGRPESSHTAYYTLVQIAREQRIRASANLIRGKFRVVSFTEIGPRELTSIRKWRRGFSRWTMEPYGFAARKMTLSSMGARPVTYGTENTFGQLPDDEKYLFQISRVGKYDWSVEKEWRMIGDLNIRELAICDWVAILPTECEAHKMMRLMNTFISDHHVGM